MCLSTDKSQTCNAGPRLSGRLRPTLPNVNLGGFENAAGLKKLSTRCLMLPGVWLEMPVLFGRCVPPDEFVVSAADEMDTGCPLWIVVMPFRLHPPATARSALWLG